MDTKEENKLIKSLLKARKSNSNSVHRSSPMIDEVAEMKQERTKNKANLSSSNMFYTGKSVDGDDDSDEEEEDADGYDDVEMSRQGIIKDYLSEKSVEEIFAEVRIIIMTIINIYIYIHMRFKRIYYVVVTISLTPMIVV